MRSSLRESDVAQLAREQTALALQPYGLHESLLLQQQAALAQLQLQQTGAGGLSLPVPVALPASLSPVQPQAAHVRPLWPPANANVLLQSRADDSSSDSSSDSDTTTTATTPALFASMPRSPSASAAAAGGAGPFVFMKRDRSFPGLMSAAPPSTLGARGGLPAGVGIGVGVGMPQPPQVQPQQSQLHYAYNNLSLPGAYRRSQQLLLQSACANASTSGARAPLQNPNLNPNLNQNLNQAMAIGGDTSSSISESFGVRLPPFVPRQPLRAASLVNSVGAAASAHQTAQFGRAITFADYPLQTQTQTFEYECAICICLCLASPISSDPRYPRFMIFMRIFRAYLNGWASNIYYNDWSLCRSSLMNCIYIPMFAVLMNYDSK